MPEPVKKRAVSARWFRTLFAATAVMLAASVLACKPSQQSDGNPTVLRYVFVPAEEQMLDTASIARMMGSYLKSQLHIPVETYSVDGYAPTIEAMRTGKADIASFGPLGYILASQKAGAEAIVSAGKPDGTLDTYNSIIVVPKNSPIHSMADLKAHAKNLVFMFVDPASTSGYLIPSAYLRSIGIDPDKDFGKVVFAGNHLAAILTIKSGKVDAGAVMKQIMIPRLIALGKLAPGDLRTLWTSDPIPESPMCVRKSLPAPLKEQIRQALLAIPQKDPALWAALKKMYRKPDMVFVPVHDSAYDGLRKLVSQIKDFNTTEQ